MKKLPLLILGASLALGGLTACDNNSSSLPVREDWTEAEVSSIKSALRDVTIPFFQLSGEYDFEASTSRGMVLITMENASNNDLKNIQKAFTADADWEISTYLASSNEQPYLGVAVYAGGNVTISGTNYVVLSQYGLYTNDDDFGVVKEGTLQFAALLTPVLEDYSNQYETYALLKDAVVSYFDHYEAKGLTLPNEITTSADSFEMTDFRYVYYYYYQRDLGAPYAVMSFYNALETELSNVEEAFVNAGYEKKTQEATSSSDAYEYFFKDGFRVSLSFNEAKNGVPQAIDVAIFPASK